MIIFEEWEGVVILEAISEEARASQHMFDLHGRRCKSFKGRGATKRHAVQRAWREALEHPARGGWNANYMRQAVRLISSPSPGYMDCNMDGET